MIDFRLVKYDISPRVLKADCTQTVTITGLDDPCKMKDGDEYIIKVTPMDDWGYEKGGEDFDLLSSRTKTLTAIAKNGSVVFEYFFEGEKEWDVKLEPANPTKKKSPLRIRLYSLYEDLYSKRPFKGDLHIHTAHSDGSESPALVASKYRKFGFDFIGITDHHKISGSLESIKVFENIPTAMKLFPGEEVHNKGCGYYHIVNFNPKTSVNEIIETQPELVQKELSELEKTMDAPEGISNRELAWRYWINDAIHKAGGITIFPHPYWVVGDFIYHTQTKVSKEVFKRGYFDIFELRGGLDHEGNNKQVCLYYEMKAQGYDYPIVGSTDTHTVLTPNDCHFNRTWSVVFAESQENLVENILNKNVAVVENEVDSEKSVFSSTRLTLYTWFLLKYYYPTHDELCNPIGDAILRKVFGKDGQDEIIIALEKELADYNESFFGK